MVSVWPGSPKMTSWSATNPGSRTLCTATPSSSPPRVPARVSLSAFLCAKGRSWRRAASRLAVESAVPDGASSLSAWWSSMISTASKCGAAISARCIITTAPMAKFGATIPPTPLALHAVSSLSTSDVDRPVVPTTGEAPAATAASALCMASDGRVKSTIARGLLACKNAARSSPRPIPPTYSMPDSFSSAEARTEPTLPRCPATATFTGSVIGASRLVAPWASVAAPAVAAAAVPPAAKAAFSHRGRRGKGGSHHFRVDALLDRQTLGRQLLERGLAAQIEPALAVDLDRLDDYIVADVAHLFHPLDAVVGELGDVDQAVLSRQHFDERTERHDPHDLAFVDLADLDLVGEPLDPVDGLLAALLVDSRDEDTAVVFHVDLRPGLFGDLADHLASGADDVADLVGVDEDGRDARRVGAHLGARPRQHSEHLVEHEQTRFAGLLQRLGHDLVGQALDLDVHLERGDSVPRSRDLEVHVAQRVLDALDVRQHRELALARHQAHRDARDRGLDRHAGVHQREGRSTHRGHRRRTVGAENLGHQSDRVGPLLDRRDHSQQRALGQRSVTDLATARATQPPRLTYRVRREVVVVHVALELFGGEAVELLLVGHRAEGGYGQRLGLSPCEQARAVGTRQHADFDRDLAHVFEAPPVHSNAVLDDALPDAILDGAIEELAQDVAVLGETLAELDDGFGS